MYQKNQKKWYKHFDFIFLDLLFMEMGYLIAYMIRFGYKSLPDLFYKTDFSEPYRHIFTILICIHIAMVFFTEPYSGILRRNVAEEIKSVIKYNIYIVAGCVFVLFIEQSSVLYSRIVMVGTPVATCVLMILYRYVYKKYLQKNINKEGNQDCMLLVAPYGQVNSILHKFNKSKVSTVRIVGIVLVDNSASAEVAASSEMYNAEAENQEASRMDNIIRFSDKKSNMKEDSNNESDIPMMIRGIPVVGTTENLYEYARTNVVDEVLICLESEEVEEIAAGFMDMGITVHISIQNLVQIPRATVNRVNGISVITASVNTVTSRQLMIKRGIDILCGLLGSVVTLLLTIIIAPMMWIADPGPVFFRQERVGKNGRIFKIWKFRTMYTDAEARKAELMKQNKMSGLMFKMDDDPRVIGYGKKFSLGKFLRESSIDELPQSFNILAGSMSVVGTRPPTVKEYEQYELRHKGRLATKPGLTGMWQVSGRSDITDFEEVVRLDKEYIDNFTLALDLEIMLKTVKVVLGKEGSV